MISRDKLGRSSRYVSLLTFVAFVGCILYINRDVLYTAHDRSEFLYGTSFFDSLMLKPFGFMQYVGAWLTQLFCEPLVGAGVLALIWALIFFVGVKAFRLQGHSTALMILPIACLLTSVVDLGYWIYISTIRGYWFSQSVGYLFILTLLWVAISTPRNWHIVWYIVAVCLYPLFGWFSLLFVLCLIVMGKFSWREVVGILLVFIAARIWRTILYPDRLVEEVILAGLPQFETSLDKSESLTVPFWLLGVLSIILPLCGKFISKWYVALLSLVIGVVYTLSFMYYDDRYIDEMRMVRCAYDDKWNEVLDIIEDTAEPTTTMVMLKNVALMHEGGLLDKAFKIGNISYPINNPDSLHVTLLDIASPLVYYNYGMINEAIRLDYENAIQAGFSPFYLKMLSRCALAKGDTQLIEKYNAQLNKHLFYDDWKPAPVKDAIFELQGAYQDELTGVENSVGYIVTSISLWYDTDSKLASEQALFYSMMRSDSKRFWKSLRKFVKLHQGEEFPVHAQEAYILFLDKAPEEKRMKLPVQETTYSRYKQFWAVLERYAKSGMGKNELAEKMRQEWGDTYWYFNIFGRRVY
ncbi:MAG: DUF6057 family protein [Bacteroidia bacterium]|nr:DUF6057 family protein [Bacteroidia bacterium]